MLLTRRRVKLFVALSILIPIYSFFIAWGILALFFVSIWDAHKIKPGMTLDEATVIMGKPPHAIENAKLVRWQSANGEQVTVFDAQSPLFNVIDESPPIMSSAVCSVEKIELIRWNCWDGEIKVTFDAKKRVVESDGCPNTSEGPIYKVIKGVFKFFGI